MAEDKLKPKSYRIDDETADKLKAITAEIGGNQQEAIAKLIEAYEFQRGKAVLTNRKEDIERFENFVTILTRMYMGVLEENQNVTDTVKASFEGLLNSKDEVILKLQNENKSLIDVKTAAVSECSEAMKKKSELEEHLSALKVEFAEETQKYKDMLADKDKLNATLVEANGEIKAKNESMVEEVSKVEEIKRRCNELERRVSELDFEKERVEKAAAAQVEELKRNIQFEREKEQFEIQKTHTEELQKLKEEKQAEINSLKKQAQAEIDSYQQKWLELFERFSIESPHGEEKKGSAGEGGRKV